jgi:UPF0755 protein
VSEQLKIFTSRREEFAARRALLRARARRRRRRMAALLLAIGLVLVIVGGGAYYLISNVIGGSDFDGPGQGGVIVQVAGGDSTTEIGKTLADRGVVGSAKAFTRAASDADRIRSVQPGYYRMRLQMSSEAAVSLLLDPASRVGALEIKGGLQLDDTQGANNTTTPGVLSLISKATCADLEGRSTCISAEDLRATIANADPAELGVPNWALDNVRKAVPGRRLEGLLVPGRYDIEPGTPAVDVLRSVLAVSTARLEATNLVKAAEGTGHTPYEILVIASLVEKEGVADDFGKIARVIYNRLGSDQRLEMDSTVNYPLDLQAIRTSTSDRGRAGPYNTYLNKGLPPTPIAAPSVRAIGAALAPEAGPWTFFVRCRADGTSCFASTLSDHQANVNAAIKAGVF